MFQKIKDVYIKIDAKYIKHRQVITECLATAGFLLGVGSILMQFSTLKLLNEKMKPFKTEFISKLDERYERKSNQSQIPPKEFTDKSSTKPIIYKKEEKSK